MPKIYSRYDVPDGPIVVNDSPSLTQQEFRDEVNIDNIISKYGILGTVPEHLVNPVIGQYGDFSDVPSFMEAQNIILQAEEDFANLPSNIRKRFNNDAIEYLEFFNNPDNYDEAVSLGFIDQNIVQNNLIQNSVQQNSVQVQPTNVEQPGV